MKFQGTLENLAVGEGEITQCMQVQEVPVCASSTAGQQNPTLSLSQLCCGSPTTEAAVSRRDTLGITLYSEGTNPSTTIRVTVLRSAHDLFKPARVGSHVKGHCAINRQL